MNIDLITTLFVYAVLLHIVLTSADTSYYVLQPQNGGDMSPLFPLSCTHMHEHWRNLGFYLFM